MAAQAILNMWASELNRAGINNVEALLERYEREPPSRELSDSDCPYPGLIPYGGDDARYFWRRAASTEAALRILNRGGRFLAIVGLPGGGKTSLLQAGILPRLAKGEDVPGSDRWRYPPAVEPDPAESGPAVFEKLVRALQPDRAADRDWVRAEAHRILDRPSRVVDIARMENGAPVVLVVDPFEDLFLIDHDQTVLEPTITERSESHLAAQFAKALAALAKTDEPKHIVIIVFRRAAAPRVRTLKPLDRDLWGGENNPACVTVLPPGSDELREMILVPGRKAGLHLDDPVVNFLLDDIVGEPWALPLLQFALRRLWDVRDGSRIILGQYKAAFGEGGALFAVQQAGESFYHNLNGKEKHTAERVLKCLVKPADVPGTGRAVILEHMTRAALAEVVGPEHPVTRVVDGLVASGLVREKVGEDGTSRLSLAHEMVVDHWLRLKKWVDESRQDARVALVRRQYELATIRLIAGRAEATLRNDRALLLANEALKLAEHFRSNVAEASKVYPEARGALLRRWRGARDWTGMSSATTARERALSQGRCRCPPLSRC